MRGILLVSAVSLCLAALAGCGGDETAPTSGSDTIRAAFQDGVAPSASYNGTKDAVLKDDPDAAVANMNFGAAPSDTLGSVPLSTAFYERRLIIRMDISSITDCSAVVSARLSIRVTPPTPDSITLEARLINMPTWKQWTEGFGGPANGVSWSTIDGTAPWTLAGGDFFSSVLDEQTVSSDSVATFSLSPAIVMEWIRHPSTNHGIIIRTTDVSRARFALVFQREYGGAARRPRLEIAYLPGG
ncbi:MAG: DNRLRE domain-containing protein [Candidatus Krumholzibacteria bacterium]|nr:DNRLRE domain-containing protein [Candidatus Krumholzibacteria bacterium]